MKIYKNLFFILFFTVLLVFVFLKTVKAQQQPNIPIPKFTFGVDNAKSPQDVAASLQILFLLTILALAPSLLIMVTSFVRVIIVFSFIRQAMGTQQLPPNQVLISLSLFLTFFIMMPAFTKINDTAMQPYLNKKISFNEAVQKAQIPLRQFMFKQTRQKDLALFVHLSKIKRPKNKEQVPTFVLIPSFMISELKTAFEIGFVIFIPFLIVDMVVASTLMSMGMMMLPPILISLPFKILLFVMVDGWHLITKSLVESFH